MNRITKAIAAATVAAITIVGLSACSSTSDAQTSGQELTEQAFAAQQAAVPYPAADLKDSLERRNLKERLIRTNKPDAIGYVYLMSFGKIIGYYTVKGKVSSTQSQMTTDQLIVRNCGGCDQHVVNAPGDDGSYGANEPGIFFFTTEGAMVETSLEYIYSDQTIPVDVPRLG